MFVAYLSSGVLLYTFTVLDNVLLVVAGRVMLVLAVNTTWIATPEMYRTSVRATGHGVANFYSRLGALIAR